MRKAQKGMVLGWGALAQHVGREQLKCSGGKLDGRHHTDGEGGGLG